MGLIPFYLLEIGMTDGDSIGSSVGNCGKRRRTISSPALGGLILVLIAACMVPFLLYHGQSGSRSRITDDDFQALASALGVSMPSGAADAMVSVVLDDNDVTIMARVWCDSPLSSAQLLREGWEPARIGFSQVSAGAPAWFDAAVATGEDERFVRDVRMGDSRRFTVHALLRREWDHTVVFLDGELPRSVLGEHLMSVIGAAPTSSRGNIMGLTPEFHDIEWSSR